MWPVSRLRRTSVSEERLFDLKPRTGKQSEVINLKPPFIRRYHKPLLAGLVVLVIGSLTFTRFFTQASAAYFYPQSCLGTWKYVSRAEGKPQADEPEQVAPSNAAQFRGDSQDIFCGGFAGSVPDGAAVTRMQLRFSWVVTDEKLVEEDVIVVPASDAEPGTDGSPIPDAVIDAPPATGGEFEIKRIEPDGTPHQDAEGGPAETGGDTGTGGAGSEGGASGGDAGSGGSDSGGDSGGGDSGGGDAGGGDSGGSDSGGGDGGTSFFGIGVAHAQETENVVQEAVETAPQESVDPTPEEASESPADQGSEPGIVADPAGEATGTTEVPVTIIDMDQEQEEVSADAEPGSAFLGIYFTTDGTSWSLLKNVTKANWREPIELPLTAWEDIAKLQVKVSRIQTLDEPPLVYLDGIELAAEYGDGEQMPMPDLEKDQPVRILSNESYVVADVLTQENGRRTLWLFERGENPQWLQLADDEQMASSTALALRGANVFWVSRDRRSVTVYRADTKTSFSQTLDPRTPAAQEIPFDNGSQVANYQGDTFSFLDPLTGTVTSGDDSPFSAEFWQFVRDWYAGKANASSTDETASSTAQDEGGMVTTTPAEVVEEEAAPVEQPAPAEEPPAEAPASTQVQ